MATWGQKQKSERRNYKPRNAEACRQLADTRKRPTPLELADSGPADTLILTSAFQNLSQ